MSFVRAAAVLLASAPYVAVVTKDLVAGREFMFDEPMIKRIAASNLPPMRRAVVFNVVNGEETDVGFSTALADFSISIHYSALPNLLTSSNSAAILFGIGTGILLQLEFVLFAILFAVRRQINYVLSSILFAVGVILGPVLFVIDSVVGPVVGFPSFCVPISHRSSRLT
jgi:hypothetical protein